MCDPASSVVAEAELSAAPPGRTARLVLDLGYADAEVAAVARDLADGVLRHVEAMLADPATDLPTAARAGRADQRWGHRHRAGHAADTRVAGASGRAGSVKDPG